jgi:hypothetical protein
MTIVITSVFLNTRGKLLEIFEICRFDSHIFRLETNELNTHCIMVIINGEVVFDLKAVIWMPIQFKFFVYKSFVARI